MEHARDAAVAAGISRASFAAPVRRDRAVTQSRRRAAHEYDSDDDDDDEDDEDDYDDEDETEGPPEPAGLGDVWADVRGWCMDRVAKFIREEASNLYTEEEREMGVENVRTGLKRDWTRTKTRMTRAMTTRTMPRWRMSRRPPPPLCRRLRFRLCSSPAQSRS